MTRRIFFYVQHLLGIGHLRRAGILARAMAAGGFDVLLVSGGAPLPLDLGAARFHQLPPVRARDEGLRTLARLDGTPLDDGFRAARARELVDLLRREAPHVVITEQFPFGRTQLRFELAPLIEAARGLRPRPLIVSSVRDVLRRTVSAERVAETIATFEAFDSVLIHADPALASLEASFAGWAQIKDRAVYTGYVVEEGSAALHNKAGKDEVVVSVGGGAVGLPLLEAAIGARPRSVLADRPWRLLLGNDVPMQGRSALQAAGDGFIVEAARADFIDLLRNSTLSISQAGYNTVIETLRFADRAVLAPFGTARETEQADRARMLADRGMVVAVPAEALSPESLASAVDRAMAAPSLRSFPPCDVRGAAATVDWLQARVS